MGRNCWGIDAAYGGRISPSGFMDGRVNLRYSRIMKVKLGFWRAIGIVLASLLVSGLPQLHYGRVKKALAIGAIGLVLQFFAGVLILRGPAMLFLTVALLVPFTIYILADAFGTARGWLAATPGERSRPAKWIYAVYCAVMLSAGFAAPMRFAAYQIPSGSMIPTFQVGDRIVVDSGAYEDGRKPARGDIVVFDYPKDPSVVYVKRVTGLPGETVEIRDKVLYVNSSRVDEKYPLALDPQSRHAANFGPLTVPEGEYFVMGDNRDHSNDSRFWGTVPETNLKGKYLYNYWPLSRLGANPGP